MSIGMKHWVGLVLVGCAAVALRLVPPSEFELPLGEAPTPESVYERALQNNAVLANARLQRMRLAEAVIPPTVAADGPLAFGVPEGADPQEVERVRADALIEAEAAGVGGRGVALGLFYVVWREGGYPGAPTGYWSEAEYYFGERDGRAYCVTVITIWRMGRNGIVRLSGVPNSRSRLGVCQAVARFGLPGEAARSWLERDGTAMAATLDPSNRTSFTFSSSLGTGFERRGFLGLPSPGSYSGPRTLAMEQCFAGVADGCATLFLNPSGQSSIRYLDYRRAPELLDSTPLSAVQSSSAFEPADRHVLADLVAEFGEERFARWWASDGTTGSAFQDAFGVDAGGWYGSRVAELVKVSEPGPRVALSGIGGVFLFLALATLAGGAWAGRRRVA
ncbi:MAG: hypothetical protein Q8N53_02180 [Longimicrobiales bacterium]|nr:hypothetical protein [Longimicrobiales bacterium]